MRNRKFEKTVTYRRDGCRAGQPIVMICVKGYRKILDPPRAIVSQLTDIGLKNEKLELGF